MNDSALDGLTDEQIRLIEEELAARRQGQGQPQPANITVSLPNGLPFTGTQEEVNQALADSYAELNQPEPPQQNMQQTQQWNQKEFFDTAKDDYRKGMEYYFRNTLGFEPKEAFELLGRAVKVVNDRVMSFEKDRLKQTHQEIKDEHFDTLNKIVMESGWAVNAESLENAYHIARGRGLIEAEAPVATHVPQPRGGFNAPPVHIPGVGGNPPSPTSQQEIDELNRMAGQLPTDQLGEFLRKNPPVNSY